MEMPTTRMDRIMAVMMRLTSEPSLMSRRKRLCLTLRMGSVQFGCVVGAIVDECEALPIVAGRYRSLACAGGDVDNALLLAIFCERKKPLLGAGMVSVCMVAL